MDVDVGGIIELRGTDGRKRQTDGQTRTRGRTGRSEGHRWRRREVAVRRGDYALHCDDPSFSGLAWRHPHGLVQLKVGYGTPCDGESNLGIQK